jgi:inner membrane protein
MVAVTASFAGAGRVASAQVESLAAKAFPSERLIDRVLSPQPMNPVCWDVLLVQVAPGGTYTIRHGMVSNLATLIPAAECPRIFDGSESTAPMKEVAVPSTRVMRWMGEFSMETSRLASLVEGDCEGRALMQFVRAPFAVRVGEKWVLGDLRFDREVGLGLAEVELDGAAACRYSVPWVAPRGDLLLRSPQSPGG